MRYLRPRVLLAALLLGPAAAGAAEMAAAPDPALLLPAVSVVPAERREIVDRAVVTGTLVPRDEILVSPEVEGLRITELLVEEGDKVAKGQVLARLSLEMIETQEAANAAMIARAQAAIIQAKSQIMEAEAAQIEAAQALERTRTLSRTGIASAVTLEQRIAASQGSQGRLAATKGGLELAQADLATARAQAKEIALRRARTEIRAPEGGIINRRTARVGATATAVGEPLFRLIARGEIELEGEVPETALPRLAIGNPAELDLDEGRTLKGRVRRVYPEVDRATRLGKVRVSLDPEAKLHIGAFARGRIEVARRNGVAVPLAAVLYAADGSASVLAAVDDKVAVRKVTTGLSTQGFTEIRTGLDGGELVVARAGSFLRDGDKIRSVLPKATAASAEPVVAESAPAETAPR